MAKKKLKVIFDSPVIIICAMITILLYMLDKWALHNVITASILTCPGTSNGSQFDPLSLVTYLRIFLHCFGATDWSSLLINTSFFLLLGPLLEDRYGSPMLILMMAASVLVSGVFASFSPVPMTGSYCVVFTMILLLAVFFLSKKQIQVSWILIFLIYLIWTLINAFENNRVPDENNPFVAFFSSNIPTLIDLMSGVCGSLFGFLVAPKPSRSRKAASEETKFTSTYTSEEKKDSEKDGQKSKKRQQKSADMGKFEYIDLSGIRSDDEEMISVSDLEKRNSRKGRKKASDEEEEVIGTIKF